jgi:hypothetical protein
MLSALLLFAQTQWCIAAKTWPAVEKGPDTLPTIELSLVKLFFLHLAKN